MKKMMMAVAGLAMAVVMTGCGGSPKGVAEKFMNAVIQRETDKALKYVDTTTMSGKEVKNLKEALDNLGKDINDNKLESEAIYEEINVPAEDSGYTLKNGAKYVDGETATVKLQFVNGKDRKADGRELKLVKVDGSWKVNNIRTREVNDKDKDGNDIRDKEGKPVKKWVVGGGITSLSKDNFDTEAK